MAPRLLQLHVGEALPAAAACRTSAARSRQAVRCFSNGDSTRRHTGMTLRFQLPYRCKFGQQLCIVGAPERLGGWDVARGVPMQWTEGDVWVAELELPRDGGAELTYKYVVRNASTLAPVRWQEGSDCTLRLPSGTAAVVVREAWDWDASKREVQVEPLATAAAEAAAAAAAGPAVPARRGRRKKAAAASAASDEDEALAAIERAADRALQQLDMAVTASMELVDTSDPSSPELLAADRVVAAAARRATAMSKALTAAGEQLLISSNADGSGSKARRRRAPKQQQEDASD